MPYRKTLITARAALLISILSCFLSFAGNVAVYVTRTRVSAENCRSVEAVTSYIRAAILRSQQTLPTLRYYKDNPEDLQLVLQLNANLLGDIQPRDCSETWHIW